MRASIDSKSRTKDRSYRVNGNVPVLPGQPLDKFSHYAAPGTTYLYALVDPRDHSIRYLGKANNAARRAIGHYYERNKPEASNEQKKIWHRELEGLGLKPIVRILDVIPRKEWRARETELITKLREQGHPLLNASNGGDGTTDIFEYWTLNRTEAELHKFCAGRDTWPTQTEFIISGKQTLWEAVYLRGGHAHWATQFALPLKPHGEERVRAELLAMCIDRKTFPSYSEFSNGNAIALYNAIGEFGGIARWADELGLKYEGKQPWNKNRLERELKIFCKDRVVFPTQAELKRGGLVDAIRRHGGRTYWASRMNLPLQRLRWNAERLRTELNTFCKDQTKWPTEVAFKQAGIGRLLDAVRKHGGVAYWAAEMNLAFTHPLAGKPNRKPEDRRAREMTLQHKLTTFCVGRMTFPTRREFEAGGVLPLYCQAVRLGGLEHWADELGLGIAEAPFRWTEDIVRERLQEFCQGRKTFPSRSELNRAGLTGGVRRFGGTTRWVDELNLPAATTPWTEKRIRQELEILCTELHRWPTVAELTKHSGSGLITAIRRKGGAAYWAAELGLTIHRHSPSSTKRKCKSRKFRCGLGADAEFVQHVLDLETYAAYHGTIQLPYEYSTSSGFQLGAWCSRVRSTRRQGALTHERIAMLDRLGFSWEPLAEQFPTKLAAFAEFKKKHGHAHIPAKYVNAAGVKLGSWVAKQRVNWRKGSLSAERIAALDELGFVWEPLKSRRKANH